MVCWRRFAGLRDPAAYQGWFYRLLVREGWRLIRRAGRPSGGLECADSLLDEREAYRPAANFALREREREVVAAVQNLNYPQRTTIVLFYCRELSIAEIAMATGVPEGTVKSRLHAARLSLGRVLADGHDPAIFPAGEPGGLGRKEELCAMD